MAIDWPRANRKQASSSRPRIWVPPGPDVDVDVDADLLTADSRKAQRPAGRRPFSRAIRQPWD